MCACWKNAAANRATIVREINESVPAEITLDVLFFASIRERLDVERLTCAPERNVDALIDTLSRTHGAAWAEILRAPNVIIAVNHDVVTLDHALRAGDEVAFFPPVTGG